MKSFFSHDYYTIASLGRDAPLLHPSCAIWAVTHQGPLNFNRIQKAPQRRQATFWRGSVTPWGHIKVARTLCFAPRLAQAELHNRE